jgi:Dullard-like phosphatase family protein
MNIRVNKVIVPYTNMQKLLVLDLDETLIHWIMDTSLNSDTGSSEPIEADVILKMSGEFNWELPLNIRPHFKDWILELNKHYQIIIFTASEKAYADTIIDHLDPTGELIEHRVYRSNCIVTNNRSYIKDLRIFEDQWDLKDIILVDNLAKSFTMQTNNGIPILPFYRDKSDMELVHLTHYLVRIVRENDFRPILKGIYWLEMLYHPKISKTIGGDVENTYQIDSIEYMEQEIDDVEYEKLQEVYKKHSTKGVRRQNSYINKRCCTSDEINIDIRKHSKAIIKSPSIVDKLRALW